MHYKKLELINPRTEPVSNIGLCHKNMYYCYGGSNENDTENLMAEFGEFALLDSEGMPVGYVMQKYNWTETSLSITF
jgi:hypothetical protein